MTFDQIDYFIAAVRSNTFFDAAESLNITQSTLSKQMKKLEAELDIPLWERKGRQAVLTPAGERFFQEALKISAQYHTSLKTMHTYKKEQESRLRIGTLPLLSQYHLTPVLQDFIHQNPDIHLLLQEGEEPELLKAMSQGLYDIIFVRQSMLENSGNEFHYEFLPLAYDSLVVLLPKGHPLALKNSLSIKEIACEPLLLMPAYTAIHQLCMKLFSSAKITPNLLRNARMESIIGAVESGEGISIFAKSNFQLFQHENIVAAPLRNAPRLVIGAAYPKESTKNPVQKHFLQYLQNRI